MEPLIADSRPGAYALWLTIAEPLIVTVGQRGELHLSPGYCVYVGSALGPGGLRARIAHHARIAARPHWHIDYLRRHAPLIEVWCSADPVRREHHWAALLQTLGGTVPLPGFGSSDCRCPAHLFHFATLPDWPDFVQALQTRYPDHARLERRLIANPFNTAVAPTQSVAVSGIPGFAIHPRRNSIYPLDTLSCVTGTFSS